MLRHLDKSLKILNQTISKDIKNTEEKTIYVEDPPTTQVNVSHDKYVTVSLPLTSLNIEDISKEIYLRNLKDVNIDISNIKPGDILVYQADESSPEGITRGKWKSMKNVPNAVNIDAGEY